MARFVRTLYRWAGMPGEGTLQRDGVISDARLRAWEYSRSAERPTHFVSGSFRDTVRPWNTARPDLEIPETIWVGDREEREG